MKKLSAILLLPVVILSSCWATQEAAKTEKKPFIVETKLASDFPTSYTKEKSGRLVGSSTIVLASQGVGRVASVSVKEGASVKKGQVLATLLDTTANYGIRQDQAKNGVKSADATIASTKLTLDKAVDDSRIALERSKLSYASIQVDAEKKLEKAKRDAAKAVVSSTGSDAQIALDKAILDLDNLKKSNATTVANYQSNYSLTVSDLKKLVEAISFDADKILGISDDNRTANDGFELYLSAKNSAYRAQAESLWRQLATTETFLDKKAAVQVNETNLLPELTELSNSYAKTREFLIAMNNAVESSIAAGVAFPQSQIDGYVSLFNGYKTQLSGLEASFVGFKNGASSFLSSYKNNEASAAAGLEVQKKNLATGEFEASIGLDRTKIAIQSDVDQAKLALESAQSNYNNAVANREVTLTKLAVSHTDAVLALEQANKDAAKLSIVSPIDATVTRVNTSVGQDIGAGTPIVEIASNTPEIIFDLDTESVALLKIGSQQPVEYDNATYTGTVVGVSQVANDSLLYTARIILSKSPKYLWGVATIKLSLKSEYQMLPNEMVRVISEAEGELTTLSGGILTPLSIKLGNSVAKSVEILTPLDPKTVLVTSDVSNFDERAFKIEVKN